MTEYLFLDGSNQRVVFPNPCQELTGNSLNRREHLSLVMNIASDDSLLSCFSHWIRRRFLKSRDILSELDKIDVKEQSFELAAQQIQDVFTWYVQPLLLCSHDASTSYSEDEKQMIRTFTQKMGELRAFYGKVFFLPGFFSLLGDANFQVGNWFTAKQLWETALDQYRFLKVVIWFL